MAEVDLSQQAPFSTGSEAARMSVATRKIGVLDLLRVLKARRPFVFRVALIAAVCALAGVLLLKNNYQSTAVILPPHQEQSASSLLSGQLGSLATLGGGSLGGSALSLKNPNEIYSQLLLSRTISTRLIARYNLKERFKQKTEEDTIKALAAHTAIELDKSNLIRITVTTHDPAFSSTLANAYVDQLHDLNTNLALTDSSQRRAFYQQQLDQEKVLLAKAEADLQQTQRKTGLLQSSGQADVVARNIASIRAQITSRSAELQSLGTFATRQNPDYQRLRSEIGSLQAQLSSLENSNKVVAPGDIEVPTARLPESALEYTRKLREVRLHESIYELLIKQLEAAKIDEAKTAPLIQVVDEAVPAERKSGPPRTLIVLGVGILAAVLAAAWTLASHVWSVFREDSRFALD